MADWYESPHLLHWRASTENVYSVVYESGCWYAYCAPAGQPHMASDIIANGGGYGFGLAESAKAACEAHAELATLQRTGRRAAHTGEST